MSSDKNINKSYVSKIEKQNNDLIDKCKSLEEKLDRYIEKYGELKPPEEITNEVGISTSGTFNYNVLTASASPISYSVDKSCDVFIGNHSINEKIEIVDQIKIGVDYLVEQYKIKKERKVNMITLKFYALNFIQVFNRIISAIL
jgi:hypothetical protein